MPESAYPRPFAEDDEMIMHVFVYGTLRPGDVRWHHLRPFVVDGGRHDAVRGAIFDTGLDYPAAIFDGEGTIHGETFELVAHTLDECLVVLDEVEDTANDRYDRVRVTTEAGVRAWAYQCTGDQDLLPIESGDWFDR